MHVAVIGAGAAGLSSARQLIAKGVKCTVFELAPDLGGTWLYTDNVGKDQFGYPVYSAMYKGLRTNLPKEVMGFPDFPIPNQEKSYLTQQEILNFLNSYAELFNLRPHIQFNTHVMEVNSMNENKWKITSVHKPTNTRNVQTFDGVMICNGHYNDPICPDLKGKERFAGKQLHSQEYRSPEGFEKLRVLLIGCGPSGMDLTLQISKVASKVILSHHSKDLVNSYFPSNVEIKPDVDCILSEEEIQFVDGSVRNIDVILYCTGYNYSFPFLGKDCGITVEDQHIQPLYKHMINIKNPTMCFIGVPFNVCAFQMFDLQARYFVAFISKAMQIPTQEEMFDEMEVDMRKRYLKGYSKRQAHLMGPDQYSYYVELAKSANTNAIPEVIVKLRDESVKRLYDDLLNFREDRYEIVDEENFIKVH